MTKTNEQRESGCGASASYVDLPAMKPLLEIRNWVATDTRLPYLSIPADIIAALDQTKDIPGAEPRPVQAESVIRGDKTPGPEANARLIESLSTCVDALQAIVAHQEAVGGGLELLSATRRIAQEALDHVTCEDVDIGSGAES